MGGGGGVALLLANLLLQGNIRQVFILLKFWNDATDCYFGKTFDNSRLRYKIYHPDLPTSYAYGCLISK